MTRIFNSEMLVLGRQARGMSQTRLAAAVALTQGHLSKIEHGATEPSGDVVAKLANALKFPRSFFHQSARVYGLPLSVHAFRKKQSVGKKALDRVNAEINIRILHLRKLLQSLEFEGKHPLPRLDLDEFGNVEKIANLVRRTWYIPNGPLKNLTAALELAGVLVILCDFRGVSIDGLTMAVPDLPPCIFVNKDQPADRMRFSLAHELGHLVMHHAPSAEMEQEANQFASALLMPRSDIRGSFRGKITLFRLMQQKPVWRVSIQSLLMRAKDIGAITPNQSRYLWTQISQKGMRNREPPQLDFPPEKPTILPEIFKYHFESLGYNINELSNILHIYPQALSAMYSGASEEIRRITGETERRKRFKIVGFEHKPGQQACAASNSQVASVSK
ncbi:MAG: ImmA/IrrE family metallo-endopeptidase [bacterium]|nr:ImmA/IrrE family metallo-endopeptidase [bacterium]